MTVHGRLRVLVYAPHEPWPLDGGGRLHLYHVLRELAARARVTLALSCEARHREHYPEGVDVIEIPRTPRYPPTARRGGSGILKIARRHFGTRPEVAAWLDAHAQRDRYDVVMLNGAVAGQYCEAVHVPCVWNPQDELVLATRRATEFAPLPRRVAAWKHVALYAAYERAVARRVAATIFVSTVDAACARRWAGGARLEVIQNGTDFAYFTPREEAVRPGTIVFVGSLEFPPNVDGVQHFAERVWPTLHARDGTREWWIVGRRPVAAVQALAARPGIRVWPDVPDVRPYLARAAVVIVPTRTGGGLKNKILEACALRRPVVASLRAVAGLSVRRGADVVGVEHPECWIAAVERLLRDSVRATSLAAAGYAWVRRAHSWERAGARFHEVLSGVAARGAAPRNGVLSGEGDGAGATCGAEPALAEERARLTDVDPYPAAVCR